MKKLFHLIIGMIMLVTLTIIFTKPALADVDYDITNVDVTAHVNANGSLLMERYLVKIHSQSYKVIVTPIILMN